MRSCRQKQKACRRTCLCKGKRHAGVRVGLGLTCCAAMCAYVASAHVCRHVKRGRHECMPVCHALPYPQHVCTRHACHTTLTLHTSSLFCCLDST